MVQLLRLYVLNTVTAGRLQGKRPVSCSLSPPVCDGHDVDARVHVSDVFFVVSVHVSVVVVRQSLVDNFKSDERILFYWQVTRRDLLDFQR